MVRMEELGERRPRQLSGGQAQRVAVALEVARTAHRVRVVRLVVGSTRRCGRQEELRERRCVDPEVVHRPV